MQRLEKTNEDVFTFRDDEVGEGWERYYHLMSDVHLDNPLCRRDMLERHLDISEEKQAKVLSFGDLFCAMGGKFDPRRSKTDVRPENNNDLYLDSIVRNNYKFLSPWAHRFALLGQGNHETSITKHNETDLTERLAEKLGCAAMGYSGYVRFLFNAPSGGRRTQRTLFWHHGSGGGGEMTKGAGRVVRQAAWVPDADIVVGGHIHEEWEITLMRSRLSASGKTYIDKQTHLQLPTLKDEFTLSGGYHIESGRPPKPLGTVLLRFFFDGRRPGCVGTQFIKLD